VKYSTYIKAHLKRNKKQAVEIAKTHINRNVQG